MLHAQHNDDLLSLIAPNFLTVAVCTIVIIGCFQFIASSGSKCKHLIKFGLAIILYNCLTSLCGFILGTLSGRTPFFIYKLLWFSSLLHVIIYVGFVWFVFYCNNLLSSIVPISQIISKHPNEIPSIFDTTQNDPTNNELAADELAKPIFRFLHYIIDTVLVTMLTMYVLAYFSRTDKLLGILMDISRTKYGIYIFSMLVGVLYYTLFEKLLGCTVGKALTNTRVINKFGNNISWNQAFGRSLGRLVPLEGFSGFSTRMLHDSWTNTFVVDNNVSNRYNNKDGEIMVF